MEVQARISKYEFAMLFGLIRPSGQVNYKELRTGYFTDKVLSEIGITPDEYSTIRRFTYTQSLKLLKIFEIEKSDIEDLYKPSPSKDISKKLIQKEPG